MANERHMTTATAEVLARIQSEIEGPSKAGSGTPFAQRMAHLQALQRHFRSDPIGGRLVFIKRFFGWFSASTFDRQAKVIEALLDLVEDLGAELDEQHREVERLRSEIRGAVSRPEEG